MTNREKLIPILQTLLLNKDRDDWLNIFEGAGVPAGPINNIEEVFENPQILARDMKVNIEHPLNRSLELPGNPIKLSRTPVQYNKPPPMLGEHTQEVMEQFGLDLG